MFVKTEWPLTTRIEMTAAEPGGPAHLISFKHLFVYLLVCFLAYPSRS